MLNIDKDNKYNYIALFDLLYKKDKLDCNLKIQYNILRICKSI